MSDKAAEPQSIAHWPTLRIAGERIAQVRGIANSLAIDLLYNHLRSGMLAAYVTRWARADYAQTPVQHESPSIIFAPQWQRLDFNDVYTTGDAMFDDHNSGRTITFWWSDIRVRPNELDQLFPRPKPPPTIPAAQSVAPPPSAPAKSESNKGGRPRKDFWDDLWVDMCRQIYAGNLGPGSKQAAIERAMLDWATAHDHELSEQTARPRARILLAALKAEDKN